MQGTCKTKPQAPALEGIRKQTGAHGALNIRNKARTKRRAKRRTVAKNRYICGFQLGRPKKRKRKRKT